MVRPNQTFIDQVKIFIKAGDGGDGHVGFFRAKFIPKGGPDGGDGGRGGDLIFAGSGHKSTLLDFRYKKHFEAKDGKRGGRNQRKGADGESLEILVPLGTVFLEVDTEKMIGEITKVGEKLVIGEGGKGGLGNVHFASSTNRAPKKATPGQKREGRWIRLELRLLADVGIIGLPNAGKSTLLSAVTQAKPKIADYPFTTLSPSLGVVTSRDKSFTVADMPGLIEGAHQGAGLGIQFLRHIQRTRLLLYVVEAIPGHVEKTWQDFTMTKNEIAQYDQNLLERPFLVTINKVDLSTHEEQKELADFFKQKGIIPLLISAKKNENLDALVQALHDRL